MSTAAMTHQSQQLALELYALLKEIDPARFKADMEAVMRKRLRDLDGSLTTMLEGAAAHSDQLKSRLHELSAVLRDRRMQSVEEWRELSSQLQAAYGALAKHLKAADIHVPELRPTNYSRNVLHVVAAVLALLVTGLVPSPWLQITAATLCVAVWTMEALRHYTVGPREKLLDALGVFAHPHEHDRINSSTWYVNALLVLTLFFDPPIIMAAVAVLGLSDPAAAIIGRRFGRIKLLHGRSLEGTLTFAIVGTLAAAGMLALMTPWSAGMILAVATSAAIFGAVAELVSRKVDDNFSIPVAAALGALLVIQLLA